MPKSKNNRTSERRKERNKELNANRDIEKLYNESRKLLDFEIKEIDNQNININKKNWISKLRKNLMGYLGN